MNFLVFMALDKRILKFIWKDKHVKIVKKTIKKKSSSQGKKMRHLKSLG